MDLADVGSHYEVKVELPGIPRERIDVVAREGRLEIRGDVKTESKDQSRHYYRREIGQRSYYRSIALPNDADSDGAQATLKDGTLQIRIPKSQRPTRGRRVPVQ